ncbi:MAG: succinate dehydrogenase iron-sulfur subunit [Thermoguttaceae bacterium]|jgi:succinate dehydrogenase / fumarate reductase iron-sulfur subunit|nr:succinate dehydrogenase iron-sulfur subunit [Thermoguttaceae bacterium]
MSTTPHSDGWPAGASSPPRRTFDVVVLRQDGPGRESYWERHRVEHEPDMNVISVLQKIAAQARTAEGKPVAPVAWECNCLEEVCGACTMVVNGRVRQACTALVDRLLAERPGEIELRPMSKFPVIRDLVVDRSRMFETLKKIQAWLPVDSYYDMGPGPRQSQESQQLAYTLSKCMTCGCCLEVCPQFLKIELAHKPGETDAAFEARQREAFRRGFLGAFAIAQIDLFNTNPIGQMNAHERLDALIAEGGVQVCGNAQNCVKVCPKQIPLTTSIARAGRAATFHVLRKWFDR